VPAKVGRVRVYAPVSKSKTEKGKFVTKRRDFQPTWFERFPWLEFSLAKKAAFCYCCRHFAVLSQGGDTTFIKNGFSDWFYALENKRGLRGHDDSLVQIHCRSCAVPCHKLLVLQR